MSTSAARYGGIAITLHWLLALMIVGAFGVGIYMHELSPSLTKLKLYNWHKWAGVTILALSALRLLWRLTHRPPPDLPMPAWQARAAHLTHGALYLMFFVVPLVGWAYSSAAGYPVVLFGVLPLPDFVPADKALAQAIKPWHERSAWVLALLVAAHVGAALKHHFIDHDGLLDRMRPGRG
ncbi:MAG: cytochrome b [Burkholderiales bacterium]|nr:cytochrome b [Burkholderiales bacterium]